LFLLTLLPAALGISFAATGNLAMNSAKFSKIAARFAAQKISAKKSAAVLGERCRAKVFFSNTFWSIEYNANVISLFFTE